MARNFRKGKEIPTPPRQEVLDLSLRPVLKLSWEPPDARKPKRRKRATKMCLQNAAVDIGLPDDVGELKRQLERKIAKRGS